jgi:UDP-N-acetylmuramate dehydrogenase
MKKDISLQPFNTFGIKAKAKWFIEVLTTSELHETLIEHQQQPKFILGGGSNMLLTKDIDSLVIKINLKGIQVVNENDNHVWVECMAGETWHDFVMWTLKHDYGGLENLSLIPGSVGASPIQNIGAYGVELKDVFESCEVMFFDKADIHVFYKEDCKFDYRDSIFKNELKNKGVITSICVKLSKTPHQINTEYGAIGLELETMGILEPNIQEVSQAVMNIRQSKLPDPKKIGNSGSFFKNPVISKTHYETLIEKFPTMPHYPVGDINVKVPAGWLIEQSGFKGKRFGDAGIHEKQALVLVNYGNATGKELWELACTIQKTVKNNFGIAIETEVNIL